MCETGAVSVGRVRAPWLVAAFALALSGCGQKGPLYLPDKGAQVVTSPPAAPGATSAPTQPPAGTPGQPAQSAPTEPTSSPTAPPKKTDKDSDSDSQSQPQPQTPQ
jgi:predicted small lipoprotein YifL